MKHDNVQSELCIVYVFESDTSSLTLQPFTNTIYTFIHISGMSMGIIVLISIRVNSPFHFNVSLARDARRTLYVSKKLVESVGHKTMCIIQNDKQLQYRIGS